MIKMFPRLVVSGLTLAGMTVALLAAAAPAQAAKQSCLQKYRACNQRCFRYNDPVPCIHRTCERQMDNCLGADAGTSDLIVPVLLDAWRPEAEGPLTPWSDPPARPRFYGHAPVGPGTPSF